MKQSSHLEAPNTPAYFWTPETLFPVFAYISEYLKGEQ